MTNQEKSLFKAFEEDFASKKDPEEKVAACIQFMRDVLSQGGTPRLKDFWDAKNLCITTFKERMNPVKRKVFWDEYVELTNEAKRLKAILDEQSSFNLEQIELALEALRADVDGIEQSKAKVEPLKLSNSLKRLIKNPNLLISQHAELFVLNTLSARLNSLRKEIINTEMRIKHKNKLLKGISEYSDSVFPARRELIKVISDEFLLIVEAFAAGRMNDTVPPFHLKDEVKKLQNLSKELSLSSPTFKKTRDILSGCWDTIKKQEKEYAEQNAHLSEEHEKNYQALKESCEGFANNPTSLDAGNKLLSKVKETQLSRHGFRSLSDFVQTGIKVLKQKKKDEAEKAKQAERDALNTLVETLSNAAPATADDAAALEKHVHETLSSLSLSEVERMKFDALLYQVKAEVYLQANAADELQSLKKYLKDKLNEYRKGAGASSLDFEKAMLFSELTDSCRSLIERIESKL